MVRVEGQRHIRVAPAKVYGLIGRVESHPRYAGLWLTADVLERKHNALLVCFRGYLAGLPVESLQRIALQPGTRVEFWQVRGTLRTMQGHYALTELERETRLAYQVEVESGIALLPDGALGQAVYSRMERMLDRLKAAAERDLVRVPRPAGPRKGALAPAGDAAADLDEGAGSGAGPEDRAPALPESVEESVSQEPRTPVGTNLERTSSALRLKGKPPGTGGRRRRRRRRRKAGGEAQRPTAPFGLGHVPSGPSTPMATKRPRPDD